MNKLSQSSNNFKFIQKTVLRSKNTPTDYPGRQLLCKQHESAIHARSSISCHKCYRCMRTPVAGFHL